MMFTEDFSAFFRESEMASSVTVDGVSRTAIFDNGYSLSSVGVSGMASTQPSITLPTAYVPASAIGKTVVANSTSYTIAAHDPDGTGISQLFLERA